VRSAAAFCPNRECVDFHQTGEPGEYREGVVVCPKCGIHLVVERPVPPAAEPAVPEGAGEDQVAGPLVAVATFELEHQANLAASFLASNGIVVLIAADDCGRTDPILGIVTGGLRLMVSESQAKLALALLEQEARAGG